jgi:ABC-type uncharacterized transport system substrate-binding protein
VSAHPDVWVNNRITVVFDGAGRLAEVGEKWAFDYAFSILAGKLIDANENGSFDVEELVAAISPSGLLGWLGQKDYLTRLTVAGLTIPHAQVPGLAIGIVDGKLTIEFAVPMDQPQPVPYGAGIDVFDETYYYGFEYAPVQAVGAPASCRVDQRWGPNLTAEGGRSPELIEQFLADDMYAVRVQIDCRR